MWRRVDLVWTDVSEETFASIFRVEKYECEEPAFWSRTHPPIQHRNAWDKLSFIVWLFNYGIKCINFAAGLLRSQCNRKVGDRAIAQVVSCRLPTTAAPFRAQIMSCGICGGQSGTGVAFLWVLRFPLPILIPPTVPHSSSSIVRVWYNRPINGRRAKWTQFHPTLRN
jgi:hypothetical protein